MTVDSRHYTRHSSSRFASPRIPRRSCSAISDLSIAYETDHAIVATTPSKSQALRWFFSCHHFVALDLYIFAIHTTYHHKKETAVSSKKESRAMYKLFYLAVFFAATSDAFTMPASVSRPIFTAEQRIVPLHMSEQEEATAVSDPMEEAMEEVDEETRKQMEKARRVDELRAQEVFMKKSTGIHRCTNCDWEYDETKGDSMMIGGMIKPGTEFAVLPADWRCPVCRASKDAFQEVVEEIPGFEVNQGYGFGSNSWTAGQKNLAIFGGLGLFFLLFLSGYAMS